MNRSQYNFDNIREKQIEAYFTKRCREAGAVSLKFTSPSANGVPDRIVLMPSGRVAFAEIKRPGGKATALQQKWLAKLTDLGFPVALVSSKAEVECFLAELKL